MKKCNIIVKDEVNIKIEGLDLDTRKTLTNKFKFEVPGARYMPAVRLGRWDGKVGFFQLGGSSYVNLLPEIIPVLEQDHYDIDVTDGGATWFPFGACGDDEKAGSGRPRSLCYRALLVL